METLATAKSSLPESLECQEAQPRPLQIVIGKHKESGEEPSGADGIGPPNGMLIGPMVGVPLAGVSMMDSKTQGQEMRP